MRLCGLDDRVIGGPQMNTVEAMVKDILQIFKAEDTARELATMPCVCGFDDGIIRTSPVGHHA
jgi:hypothetical protein